MKIQKDTRNNAKKFIIGKINPYECWNCPKRVSIIYDGLCISCETQRRKEEADKKFK